MQFAEARTAFAFKKIFGNEGTNFYHLLHPMNLKSVSVFAALILICGAVVSYAQSEKATLILQGGEEIPCRLERIASGYVYFKAASSSLAFKYGDFIEIAKVAKIRLNDGRVLSMSEFLTKPGDSTPSSEETKEIPSSTPQPRPPEPAPREIAVPKPPSGPGVRLTSQLLDTTQASNGVGLRLPDMPPPQSTTPSRRAPSR